MYYVLDGISVKSLIGTEANAVVGCVNDSGQKANYGSLSSSSLLDLLRAKESKPQKLETHGNSS